MTYHEALRAFARQFVAAELTRHDGNRTVTAEALGVQRTYLLRLIRAHGIAIPSTAPRRPFSEYRCSICREHGHTRARHRP